MIKRLLKTQIIDKLKTGGKIGNKIILLYGARQVGKTVLINSIISELGLKTLSINADQSKYIDVFSSKDFEKMESLVAGYELLFIDEAQKIPDIGINLKILHDSMPKLKIIATGSSSFDLQNKVTEPLTGRAWSYTLFPISYAEIAANKNKFELNEMMENALIFGSYPEIFSLPSLSLKQEYMNNIYEAYLFRDVFELKGMHHLSKIRNLLRLLAFQIGSEVSTNELASILDISKNTVESYIDILEKAFVVFRLGGFSRNLRKEVSKMDKIYFYDLGVRNAAIDNFKPLADRDDAGKLWENFLIVERKKHLAYSRRARSSYFWRVYTGAELDYLEEGDGKLSAYEFKWQKNRKMAPAGFMATYPKAEFKCINKENYLEFIGALERT